MPTPIYGSPLLDGVRNAVLTRPAYIKLNKLAEDCGITRQSLHGFIAGRQKLSALTLEKIYVAVTGKQIFPND